MRAIFGGFRTKFTFNSKVIIGVIFIFILFVSGLYLYMIRGLVASNLYSVMREVAIHDKTSIRSYNESLWQSLDAFARKLRIYNKNQQIDLAFWMRTERMATDFDHIWLIDETGGVLADTGAYFPSGELFDAKKLMNKRRFVLTLEQDADTKRVFTSSVFHVRRTDLRIDGRHYIAVCGSTNQDILRTRFELDSFGGRGHSSLIDDDGNYILNKEQTAILNDKKSFDATLRESTLKGMTFDEYKSKCLSDESFILSYVTSDGVKRVALLEALPDTNWHFVLDIEENIFTDMSRQFVNLGVVVLFIIIVGFCVAGFLLMVLDRHSLEVEALSRTRAEFLSNMSHEIRTPLNGIIGLNHLMKTNIDNRDKLEGFISKASDTAKYLLNLVNDVLDMSKLQTGKIDIDKEPISMEELLRSVAVMQRSNIEDRGIEFVVDIDLPEPWVEGDEIRIKQVIMNILGNAAKFTPQGGRITLSASAEDDGAIEFVHIRVADTGCGMTEEFRKHIFESFSQERNKFSKSIKGTGLGMAISALLVKAMNGEISVESELNIGSTFFVDLPLKKTEARPQAEAEKSAIKLENLHILVAEDNELNAEILLEVLKEYGIKADHACDGKETVELFEKSDEFYYDVILMDMQMPVMDGCEATEQIRAMYRNDARSVRILACTANTMQKDRDRATASGMDGFIVKPIDIEKMIECLTKM